MAKIDKEVNQSTCDRDKMKETIYFILLAIMRQGENLIEQEDFLFKSTGRRQTGICLLGFQEERIKRR